MHDGIILRGVYQMRVWSVRKGTIVVRGETSELGRLEVSIGGFWDRAES